MKRSQVIRWLAGAGVVLALASCSSAPEPAPMPPPATPTAPPAIALPTTPQAEKDQCGLKDAQAFVGKNRT
jgi:hypothetical protein